MLLCNLAKLSESCLNQELSRIFSVLNQLKHITQPVLFAIVLLASGCAPSVNFDQKIGDVLLDVPAVFENQIFESLTVQDPRTCLPISEQQFDPGPLNNFDFENTESFRRISLEECIAHTLRNSEVVRELGGTVLLAPESVRSANDPALAYTNPAFGEETALSEFDATFSNQFLFQNNDLAFNSTFIGDQGTLTQDTATNVTSLSKRSASGATFQLNHQFVFDRNNTPANRFANNTSYDNFLTAEIRQPLLRGAGVTFNRIAGPGNPIGVNNGVLISRTNTDISLADFELGIRDLVSDIENAYWDLYFAYRDLSVKIEARNNAYELWKKQEAQAASGEKPSTEVLQAEEQYFLFATQVQNAIFGQLNDGTRTNNGSSSGTFRGNPGVRTAERRLRLLTGLSINDGNLLLPSDMPIESGVVFDWEQAKLDALNERTELRRQRWVVKREQLNLLANRQQLRPSLDLVGRYRFRGFGNDLFGSQGFDASVAPGPNSNQDGSDALATFFNGDLQEWEIGADVNIPLGYRREHAAIRNSELGLMREAKILHEQEREIIYGLSNAIGELQRAESLLDLNTKRLNASNKQFKDILVLLKEEETTIDLVLESQRRVIDAEINFHRSQIELTLAIKAIHFEKGTGLDYHNVLLAEKGWSQTEVDQAILQERAATPPLNYGFRTLLVSEPE